MTATDKGTKDSIDLGRRRLVLGSAALGGGVLAGGVPKPTCRHGPAVVIAERMAPIPYGTMSGEWRRSSRSLSRQIV